MRWLIRVIGALVVLVVVMVGLVMMIPAERIARLAADQFERISGRSLTIEGGVRPKFWPVLGVTTGPVRIANADWASDQPMLAADGMVIEISAASLFSDEIQILGLSATNPRILLERGKDGRGNWELGATAPAEPVAATGAEAGPARAFTLEKGQITGGTLRYIDHGTGQDLALDDVDLTLAIPDHSGPFTLSGDGLLSGRRVNLGLEAGSFAGFLDGRVVPVKLDAGVGAAVIRFDGRGGWSPMTAEGKLVADLSDIPALAAAAGSAASTPPQGLGAQKLAVSGDLTLDGKGAAFLRGARIEADGNVLGGDLDIATGGARPKISGNLRAERLALAGLAGGAAGGSASNTGGGDASTGWSRAPIDVSALGAVDAAVSLVVGSIDLGKLKIGQTRLMLSIDRARAVFTLHELQAYGGSVAGEFVVNGRGGLSVGGDLTLANLQTAPLLSDLAGWSRLVTQGNLSLKFLGVGNSIDAIMQGLKGEGRVSLGKGELIGLDIGGMLRHLDVNYVGDGQKTIFDGIAGSFTIANGILSNSDLKLVAPYLTATGAGEIGLGPRNLNYRIRPTAFAGEDGTGGVMVPLWITGSWAKPTYRLDLESIAREKMEAEARAAEERLKAAAAAAEARAKAQLEEKLRSELGVQANEGERLEDAVRRRAEEALSQEAGRLLEGILGGN